MKLWHTVNWQNWKTLLLKSCAFFLGCSEQMEHWWNEFLEQHIISSVIKGEAGYPSTIYSHRTEFDRRPKPTSTPIFSPKWILRKLFWTPVAPQNVTFGGVGVGFGKFSYLRSWVQKWLELPRFCVKHLKWMAFHYLTFWCLFHFDSFEIGWIVEFFFSSVRPLIRQLDDNFWKTIRQEALKRI